MDRSLRWVAVAAGLSIIRMDRLEMHHSPALLEAELLAVIKLTLLLVCLDREIKAAQAAHVTTLAAVAAPVALVQ